MTTRRLRSTRAIAAAVALAALLCSSPAAAQTAPPPAPPGQEVQSWALAPAGTSDDPDQPNNRPNLSYELDPGAVVEDAVTLYNYGNVPLNFEVYATDAFNNEEGEFDILPGDKAPDDVGSWITLPSRLITLQAGTQLTLPITVTVPDDAKPGDHVGGIVAASKAVGTGPDGAAVSVDRRTGTRVYLRVAGPVEPELAVEHVKTTYTPSLNPLGGTAEVTYTIRNRGNVRLAGTHQVEVSGPFGLFGHSKPDRGGPRAPAGRALHGAREVHRRPRGGARADRRCTSRPPARDAADGLPQCGDLRPADHPRLPGPRDLARPPGPPGLPRPPRRGPDAARAAPRGGHGRVRSSARRLLTIVVVLLVAAIDAVAGAQTAPAAQPSVAVDRSSVRPGESVVVTLDGWQERRRHAVRVRQPGGARVDRLQHGRQRGDPPEPRRLAHPAGLRRVGTGADVPVRAPGLHHDQRRGGGRPDRPHRSPDGPRSSSRRADRGSTSRCGRRRRRAVSSRVSARRSEGPRPTTSPSPCGTRRACRSSTWPWPRRRTAAGVTSTRSSSPTSAPSSAGQSWTRTVRSTVPAPVVGTFRWEATASGAGPSVSATAQARQPPVRPRAAGHRAARRRDGDRVAPLGQAARAARRCSN